MKKNINQILDNKNNIKNYFLHFLLLLSFLLRFLSAYFIRDTNFDNEWNVLLDNLIEYKSYSFYTFNGELIPSALLPPVYPFFIYLVKITTSIDKTNLLYAIIFIQILFSTYSIYLFFQINRNFFSEKLSIINSTIFSIIPLNIINCGQISSITLQIFLSLLFLKFLFLILNKQTVKNILIFSITSGLLILTRGEFILIFIFIIFYIFFKKKIILKNLIKILVTVILVISPYVIRNYIHFNEIFIVKSLGYNLWKGSNKLSSVGGHDLSKIEFPELNNKIQNLKKNKYYEINRDKIFLDEAFKNINDNLPHYIGLFVRKFVSYYFIDFSSNYPNYFNFFHIIPIIIFSLLSFPGLFVFYKKNKFKNNCLLLYLFLNLLIFSIFFILPRYKLIILPVQIILAAYFVEDILRKFKKN